MDSIGARWLDLGRWNYKSHALIAIPVQAEHTEEWSNTKLPSAPRGTDLSSEGPNDRRNVTVDQTLGGPADNILEYVVTDCIGIGCRKAVIGHIATEQSICKIFEHRFFAHSAPELALLGGTNLVINIDPDNLARKWLTDVSAVHNVSQMWGPVSVQIINEKVSTCLKSLSAAHQIHMTSGQIVSTLLIWSTLQPRCTVF